MRLLSNILLIVWVIGLFSCNSNESYIPKPRVFPRADRTGVKLQRHSAENYTFDFPNDAVYKKVVSEQSNQEWFNMEYPTFFATLYCSYATLIKSEVMTTLSDNHKLLQKQLTISSGIKEIAYTDAENSIYGSLYSLKGNVVSPLQFYLTDSTSYFLRGALYYDIPVQIDSITPITQSLRGDIEKLMESFRPKID